MTVIPLCFDRKKSDDFEKSQLINGRSKDDMVVALMEFHADFLTGIQIEIFEECNKIGLAKIMRHQNSRLILIG